MRQVFDDREMEEAERGRDTEFTLGPTSLLTLFFGLVLLCGLCFGLGYAVGHHGETGPPMAALQPTAGANAPSGAAGLRPKPSAAPQPEAPPQEGATVEAPPSTDPDADIVGSAVNSAIGAQAESAAAANQPTVKPALAGQPVQPQQAPGAGPGAPPAAALMVQIAAVSHAEDASVLMNALRRRGYAVTSHRDLTDNLIHVQVGPFYNRNDANAMRLKLLNDGYNAVVEP
jgi:DedD protein